MLYAIVSDIHANESALRHVLQDAKAKGAESFVCLGDTVGYGPLPESAVNLVRATCDVVLAGNHDDAVTGRLDPSDFIDLANDAVTRHREALSKANLDWLHARPYIHMGDGFLAAHGDFTEPKAFNYIQDTDDARANFDATEAQLMFVGHTHVPAFYLTGESGKVYRMDPTDFAVEPGKRYIVNPGSVGYPREKDGRCQSTYVLYDSVRGEVTFHALSFTVSSVMQRGAVRPKTRRRGLFAALVLALAALLGAVAFLLVRPSATPPVAAEAREPADLVIKTDTVPLTPDLRRFLPNLRLANGSAPVVLRILFRDENRKVLFSDSITIRKSRTKAYDLPPGAKLAEITLLRLSPADRPVLAEYKPAFKP